ncbi:MAG: thiol protease/hemagglutinin PrtT [Bacteroidaceae bacterium]|nr:thiol protease/hemagglutinin PrtT [Bacteroidaceae bacterium]
MNMKKLFTLFLATIVLSSAMMLRAEVISSEVAKQTADNYLMLDDEWRGAVDATVQLIEHEGVAAYYVVEYNGGGWVIVSAQSSSDPVIGYNTSDKFVAPEPMQAVLDACAENIVRISQTEGDVKHEGWERANRRKAPAGIDMPDVAPLIKMDLNQGAPYNKYCPTIDGQPTLVGCVAVGMSQAMMVQHYPIAPQGSYKYSCPDVGILSIDYDSEAPYNWEAMDNGDTDEIARLLYHCGVSVNMQYGVDGSGTGDAIVKDALERNFCFSADALSYVEKDNDPAGWLQLMVQEMVLGRVVIYFGSGDQGGHCWNLDGWKNSTQKVHVNWGWGGYGNGYFDIEKMEDAYQGMTFPEYNTAVLGVGTPTTAPYGIELSTIKFAIGTEAGVALADVIVACEDAEAEFVYELYGPKNLAGKYSTSPYEVVDGKLVSTKTVADSNAFKFLLMKVSNAGTGESFEKQFTIQIVSSDAVESVLSDAMRVYPSVADENVTIEVPAIGGRYTIYSVAGTQLQAGNLENYKNEINVSALTPGTYILQYVHNGGVGVKTFIKR